MRGSRSEDKSGKCMGKVHLCGSRELLSAPSGRQILNSFSTQMEAFWGMKVDKEEKSRRLGK